MSVSTPSAETPLWGGAFTERLHPIAHAYSRSINQDAALWREDIQGSIAHVEMLGEEGIISKTEAETIRDGLRTIAGEFESQSFVVEPHHEDIHMAIEERLIALVGPLGGKLHTGRSRNDQVATDERLFLRTAVDKIVAALTNLQRVFVEQCAINSEAIMPGYTHLQRAQPILLAHHILAYVEMFERDKERLQDCRTRINRSPLGAAAFGGTSHPIRRESTAKKLGFTDVLNNSIDAVSDRDYILEAVSALAIIAMHLSRFAEEMILWATSEFGFVKFSDAVTTGSSIMPQKKNPDMAELLRGKTGKVYGALMELLTVMKGLPLAYNRDMQEDKAPMFLAVTTILDSLGIASLIMEHAHFDHRRMLASAKDDALLATEVADYLVRKGIPFREAHNITGQVILYAFRQEKPLTELAVAEYQQFSAVFDDSLFALLTPQSSVRMKMSSGSTAPKFVLGQIDSWKLRLEA